MAEAERTFHIFPRLPTELRLEIWRLCLPYRVWDTDLPTDEAIYDEPNADGSYPCRVITTARLNGLPPVITRVCKESRFVAQESGGILTKDFFKGRPDDAVFVSQTSGGDGMNFWVDPKRDSAHLNWTPFYQSIYQRSFGSALASLKWKSRLVAGRPSIMDDWISMMVDQQEERFDVLEQLPSLWVIMRVVIIHASFREAAQTGLFGLLGDATVQIVSLADEKKANALYDFADECAREISGEVIRRESLESLKQELKDSFERNRISENASSRMHPAIMFRLCTSNCSSPKKGLSSK
ncbi:hypothetical protein N7468_003163 [Penicillium chermesinum]|uniref:2EXR domain-containing protein n=1 Tax=Penicillium chermesinum TaxID=63820 RepID=A0A9W9P640_9EURO|nr:uncharacterized protein N7468_003163 [Penicillium chermesinum]KAJ5238544.1 hypothetical protein N7468_003163 [Penicillium chermesinum]KAJ6164198.1 hypothetical protein N7470_002870 [Penicillium chermesinum]